MYVKRLPPSLFPKHLPSFTSVQTIFLLLSDQIALASLQTLEEEGGIIAVFSLLLDEPVISAKVKPQPAVTKSISSATFPLYIATGVTTSFDIGDLNSIIAMPFTNDLREN
ncbi:hypothetical protein AX774_g8105 [Zancudomyces culisetae]|uniref:Uncharacterized protein n=1 Tax=Zancudomyces culisetae TaxID=1213189 RepID=A0A1R1PC61_ZANCU|nr:hypothetical protein AX774_g8105 [Zancudomyces culisetae]|eukprot:OMH78509.1 hypothetical protein AX774_g8105 [Zancudomyces culisetae]